MALMMMILLEKMMGMIHISSQATTRGVRVQILEEIGTGLFLYFYLLSLGWWHFKTKANFSFQMVEEEVPLDTA